ncbi:MAG TPA: EAL domain-containing protein [Thermoanaerobaculia bacterium]|nr:EAL domain-containing protein [Thermoanaerobaculia bacterium]
MDTPKATVIRLLRESSVAHLSLFEPEEGEAARLTLAQIEQDVQRVSAGLDPLELATLAIEHSPDGIVIMHPPGAEGMPKILFVNRAFCRMSGASRDEVIGRSLEIFRVAETDQAVRDALLHPLCQRRAFEGEAVAVRANGSEYYLELLLVPIHDEDGEVMYWVAYMKDVSEEKAQLAALEQQALHDMLTRLPNRILLMDRVTQAIRAARRSGSQVALLLLDLDGFKEVNDTLGHHSGDIVLQQVAIRLRDQIRESDTVARLGGDEFAFVLPGVRDAAAVPRVARKILDSLHVPFVVEDQRCEIGASIGVALYPDHGLDTETLMRRADAAMYHAKRRGSQYALYAPDLDETGIRRITLGVELRLALADGQLELYYQPKIHLRSGLVTRVEALIRWNHPSRGLLLPDEFLAAAERSGFIREITEWVIDDALRQCRAWHDALLPIHVAINISGRVLQDHMLPQIVSSALDRWRISPHSLKLEITESSLMADPPQALALLSLLQGIGVRLSLDDFGTGYSSLMHLRKLPVDEIKIDKSFVMGMDTSAGDAAIVRATIDLGHNLGMQVVAEGVDNEWTCKVLTEMGCDLAQGYFLSRPLPADALVSWLEETGWGLSRWRKAIETTID